MIIIIIIIIIIITTVFVIMIIVILFVVSYVLYYYMQFVIEGFTKIITNIYNPDIIIRNINNNNNKTCMLTYVAVPGNIDVIKKETEKFLKYEHLTIEIQRMWNVKAKVNPVIIEK
jgi:hypothetical protein